MTHEEAHAKIHHRYQADPEFRQILDYITQEICGTTERINLVEPNLTAAGASAHNIGIDIIDLTKEPYHETDT